MRKNVFVTFMLVLLILTSSFTLFACGENTINPQSEIHAVILEIQDDTASYTKSEIMESGFNGFSIKNLMYKNSSGGFVEDGKVYNAIFAISLGKIIKYNDNLNSVPVNKLDGVKQSFDHFKKEFEEFKGSRDWFMALEDDISIDVYNGFYSRFKKETQGYIDATCSLAKEILKVCDNNFVLPSEDDENFSLAQAQQWQLHYDNEIIKALSDVKDLIFVSAKGENLSCQLYNRAKNLLKEIAKSAKNTSYAIANENKDKFISVALAVENQRMIVSQAISNFSLYELEEEYDGSLYSYYQTDSTKEFDYKQLNSYFLTGGILPTFIQTINEF